LAFSRQDRRNDCRRNIAVLGNHRRFQALPHDRVWGANQKRRHNEKENESFAWRSLLNADVNNAGSIHFRNMPDSDQTEVRVILSYEPPGGMFGAWAAKLTGTDPEVQVEQGLSRFKQEFESGHLH
jgi:uncharacterized membrane protein